MESPSAAHSARPFRKSWGSIPKLMGHRSEATYKVPHFPPESRPTSIGISAPLALESVPHFARNPHAATHPDMREVVQRAVSEIGLMEFMRLDVGAVLAKPHPERNPQSIRLIIGNPLIMESMARLVPDAASYAPVTVLIDRRSDGVHLSYDEMASLLAPYGNAEAVEIAGDLDVKVRRLLQEAS